jgi:hypothetical protein
VSDLEDTAIAFFRAIRAAGKKRLGHDRFGFKMNVETMAPIEDKDAATAFGAALQEALTTASRVVQPVTIEGTSLQ